jgi:uncharacterized protein
MTPRVALDTNIVVSALLKPQGLESMVLRLALAGQMQFFVSPPVLAEDAETLSKPKLKLTPSEAARALGQLREAATMVHPAHQVSESPHESDNRFLECADAAHADFLITGNNKHFPKQWRTTRVVPAREFLERRLSLRE